jgi:sulfite exporter TauE/SafE
MWQWLLILGGGLLGTGHCLGMCGGFITVLSLHSPTGQRFWLRQAVYHLGRVTSYAILGAVAGGVGYKILQTWPWLTSVWLLTAGVLLVTMSALTAGWVLWPWPVATRHSEIGCRSAGLFRLCLTAPHMMTVWLAGVLNGFLPCGLVATYLLVAAGTGNPWIGAAIMLVFGAGTLPGLILVGAGIRQVSASRRQHLQQLAAFCVCVTGILTIVRGWSSWDTHPAPCPYCQLTTTNMSPITIGQ